LATTDLTGGVITDLRAYGKHLFMEFGPRAILHSHLKMEGRWRVLPRHARWPVPAFTVRAVLQTAKETVLGIQLGKLDLMDRDEQDKLLAQLGPDPIHAWDADEARRRLLARPDRPVGLALLDQHNVAGIGNVFRSEILFINRIHPLTPIGEISDAGVDAVLETAATQLRDNAERPSRVTTGPRTRQRYYAYGRGGQPCLRCNTRIVRLRVADPSLLHGRVGGDPTDLTPLERDVFFCPACQRSSAPSPGPRP
jgi:endonuclease-8